MTASEFRKFLECAESETLDFKADLYDLNQDAERNSFVRDLLAMANTPREHPAFIVFGVKWTAESGATVVGLKRQLDDAQLQDAIGHGRVQPNPRFTYTPLEFEGSKVAVLQVPNERDGPYTTLKDYEKLQAGAVYYRRGTQNDRAVGAELRRIVKWFLDADLGIPDEQEGGNWQQFLEAVHRFEQGTTFLLAVDRISASASALIYALGLPSWRSVIDFDPDSESSGLLSCVAGSLGQHRVIHRVVRQEYGVQPEAGTHWFFARGLTGRHDTLCVGKHRAWLREYKQEVGRQLERLAASISPAPVVALLLWSDTTLRNHLRTLIEELYGAFGKAIEIVVVSSDAPSFSALTEEAGATFFQLSLRSLCGGIAVHYADLLTTSDTRCVLPTSSGAPVELEPSDWLWLSEDLELVHRAAGQDGIDDPIGFRRGEEVSWRNLHHRHDCDRDSAPMVRPQVEADLRRRQTVRINLYHAPGGGGTTVGRRIAWDLHSTWPVAVLTACSPRYTSDRLTKISSLTENSVLLIVDGGQHSERDIDDLYEFLKASRTPVVMLQILRRFNLQRQSGKRQFWLDARLTDSEADRFRHVYGLAVPSKQRLLAELARRQNDPTRNAFFFGLTAFGKDFRGLGRVIVKSCVRPDAREGAYPFLLKQLTD